MNESNFKWNSKKNNKRIDINYLVYDSHYMSIPNMRGVMDRRHLDSRYVTR